MASVQRTAEWFLAVTSAVICIGTAMAFSQQEPLFPLPGLYLFEIGAAGIVGLTAIVKQGARRSGWSVVPWIAAGILAAFAVLGIFSIGIFVAMAAATLLLAAVLVDQRLGAGPGGHVGAFLTAGIIQAGLMWSVFSLR